MALRKRLLRLTGFARSCAPHAFEAATPPALRLPSGALRPLRRARSQASPCTFPGHGLSASWRAARVGPLANKALELSGRGRRRASADRRRPRLGVGSIAVSIRLCGRRTEQGCFARGRQLNADPLGRDTNHETYHLLGSDHQHRGWRCRSGLLRRRSCRVSAWSHVSGGPIGGYRIGRDCVRASDLAGWRQCTRNLVT